MQDINANDTLVCINDIKEALDKTKEKINNKGLITTTELAKQLRTSKDVIIATSKRAGIKKEIIHGKTTYWNEEEVTAILKEFKEGKSSNNRSVELTQQLENTKTELMVKEQFEDTIKSINQMSKDEKLKLTLTGFQSLLQDLQAENQQVKLENNDFRLACKSRQSRKELKARINAKVREIGKITGNYKEVWKGLYNTFDRFHNGVDYKDKNNKVQYLVNQGYGDELLEILLTYY